MRARTRGAQAAAVALALVALGCSRPASEPVDPVWGKQACAYCSMLVTEKPPAAQLTQEGGRRHYFDDIGCMVGYLEREKAKPLGLWVRRGEAWVSATEARYERGARTPMDFGFLPAQSGVSWDEVQAAVREKLRTGRGGP